MRDKVKIAAVQMNPKIMQNRENLDKVIFDARAAAGNGAGLIVFPECTLTGYIFSSREEAMPFMETIPGIATEEMEALCKQLGVHIVVGLLEKDGMKCFNAAVLIGPGGLIGKYRKNHLPFLGIDRFLDAGNKAFEVFDTPVGRLGIHICYDATFPECARVMTLLGADILILPTNWPQGRERVVKYVINTRAYENKVHFVAVDRVGEERGTMFIGHSKIVDAWGDTLVDAGDVEEQIIYAEVSLDEARQKHVTFKPGEFELDFIRDRHPELYGPIVSRDF